MNEPLLKKKSRNLTVDCLRGVCLVLMTMDHLPGNIASAVSNARYGPFGFFTGAVGFVFLSGFVVGPVYGRDRQAFGDWAVIRRVQRRIGQIYATQLAMLLALFLVFSFHIHGAANLEELGLFKTHPLEALAMGAGLLYQPSYLGILPMYIMFLALTPLVLWQFQSDRVWEVLGGSCALWLVSGYVFHVLKSPFGANFGGFNPLAYQFVYTAGMALGMGKVKIGSLTPAVHKLLIDSCTALTALFLFLRYEYAFVPAFKSQFDAAMPFVSVVRLGPLRLLNFAAFSIVLVWFLERTQVSVAKNVVTRWLTLLGQHSLPVFAWSVMVTYAAEAILPQYPSTLWRIDDLVIAIASLHIPVMLSLAHARYSEKSRQILRATA